MSSVHGFVNSFIKKVPTLKMSKYQYSKLIMEKFLRRSFYDAVLELYETAQGTRIISVSLEGNLSLVVNKDEIFTIKLNEIAQRADDREEHQQRYKEMGEMKLEDGMDRYVVKKEEYLPIPVEPISSLGNEVINLDPNPKDVEKYAHLDTSDGGKVDAGYDDPKSKYSEPHDDKLNESKAESDSFEKSSDGESESEDDGDSELAMTFHPHSMLPLDQQNSHKTDLDTSVDDIGFLPVGQVDEYKRKLDHDQADLQGKKSPRKRRKTMSSTDGDDEGLKPDDKIGISVGATDDSNTGGLQLLPHTATAPIIIEEDDSSYGSGMTENQVAQLALFQMRDPNVGMFRQQDLEELARQQQQWQMVAYQRSIMEKSYLQQQMQQYQRDTERLRWEYVAQRELVQSRDYTQHTEEADKIYRQSQSQTAATEAALLAAAALEQAKKSAREGSDEVGATADKMSNAQYLRLLAEEHVTQVDPDYEEGELRPESHLCVLCGVKSMTLDILMRHMEKHRVAFERSCSVCQSGTLTGNMLILHMEASHGPETSFTLPSTAQSAANSAVATPASQSISDFSQSFPASLQTNYSSQVQEESSGMKLPQQPQSPKHSAKSLGSEEAASSSNVKSESEESFDYTMAASSSRSDSEMATLPQENFLGIPSQFYPLIGCQVCGEKFALSEALDAHVESQHKDACCTYSCKACCLTFKTHIEYSKHMTRHESTTTNLKCSHCLKSFKSVKQLRLHYVAAHACCHFCEYCRAGFPDAMSLQLHEQLHTLDPEKLTFRCDICSKAFYTQSQCSAHKRTHKDEKAHACEVCGSAFFKRGDLTKHVRTVHSPSRLFSCKFCGKKGTRMDNMRSHVRSHHKNMSRDQIINMIEVIE
ncbi:zinc finger autosomal protein-like [Biomphalaria glabrata]|uniref:Zinc finger autosomal protein-like n=1 Tax=Biomphalaria glabrata TaxID=6526 RepID=A0A9U8EMV5_BIOGL|nr:zinc finger autosomal protein-like [Biomphalaria glabrata]